MAVFIVLWPYLLTTKLKSVIRHNLGHSNQGIPGVDIPGELYVYSGYTGGIPGIYLGCTGGVLLASALNRSIISLSYLFFKSFFKKFFGSK